MFKITTGKLKFSINRNESTINRNKNIMSEEKIRLNRYSCLYLYGL